LRVLTVNLRSTDCGGTVHDLVAMWDGVDYLSHWTGLHLFITASCIQSLIPHRQKGNTSAFGGISIIFADDFAQLSPVGQNRLYGHIKVEEASTKNGQDAILGKLLWLSIRTIVILTENKRQTGPGSEQFIGLLT
jgi:hypothetical protein